MADPTGLTEQNVKVATRLQADPQTGKTSKIYTVSYNVGTHGPFEDTYAQAQYTSDAVKAGIAKQVQTLREVTQAVNGGM